MARYGARPATADFHERARKAKPIVPRYARQSNAGTQPESVIGPDGRTRVTNTRTFPARATALILFGGFQCSGWLISADTVVTAGHCVADGDGSPLFDRRTYEIAPGYDRNANPQAPYGVCGATRLYTNRTWKNRGRDDFDYAAIKLDCNVGNQTGFFGYRRNVVQNDAVRVQGYPGADKPFGTQWQMAGRVTVLDPRRVFYDLDTAGGQSGSPVWRNVNENCTRCGIAIHAYGTYGSPPYSNNNHGTRINDQVFQNLTNWKNAP